MPNTQPPAGPAAPPMVRITIDVAVHDADALTDYARDRYADSWADTAWTPADAAEAVLEALILSNANPSPMDYGIEIRHHTANVLDQP
jgi:hypothetical protein